MPKASKAKRTPRPPRAKRRRAQVDADPACRKESELFTTLEIATVVAAYCPLLGHCIDGRTLLHLRAVSQVCRAAVTSSVRKRELERQFFAHNCGDGSSDDDDWGDGTTTTYSSSASESGATATANRPATATGTTTAAEFGGWGAKLDESVYGLQVQHLQREPRPDDTAQRCRWDCNHLLDSHVAAAFLDAAPSDDGGGATMVTAGIPRTWRPADAEFVSVESSWFGAEPHSLALAVQLLRHPDRYLRRVKHFMLALESDKTEGISALIALALSPRAQSIETLSVKGEDVDSGHEGRWAVPELPAVATFVSMLPAFPGLRQLSFGTQMGSCQVYVPLSTTCLDALRGMTGLRRLRLGVLRGPSANFEVLGRIAALDLPHLSSLDVKSESVYGLRAFAAAFTASLQADASKPAGSGSSAVEYFEWQSEGCGRLTDEDYEEASRIVTRLRSVLPRASHVRADLQEHGRLAEFAELASEGALACVERLNALVPAFDQLDEQFLKLRTFAPRLAIVNLKSPDATLWSARCMTIVGSLPTLKQLTVWIPAPYPIMCTVDEEQAVGAIEALAASACAGSLERLNVPRTKLCSAACGRALLKLTGLTRLDDRQLADVLLAIVRSHHDQAAHDAATTPLHGNFHRLGKLQFTPFVRKLMQRGERTREPLQRVILRESVLMRGLASLLAGSSQLKHFALWLNTDGLDFDGQKSVVRSIVAIGRSCGPSLQKLHCHRRLPLSYHFSLERLVELRCPQLVQRDTIDGVLAFTHRERTPESDKPCAFRRRGEFHARGDDSDDREVDETGVYAIAQDFTALFGGPNEPDEAAQRAFAEKMGFAGLIGTDISDQIDEFDDVMCKVAVMLRRLEKCDDA